jgi:exodeoxyribonuclease-1
LQTYLFYDIETTGLSKSFDQVLHFAAIRTDLNLNEIERYDYRVKLNRDVIPSPRAVLTHHIGVHETQDGISELEAIKKIHQLLNTPGTISLGYNTLGFDDEFLRFSFYRNLLPPYTHQFANQCGRMDIYPIALMYYLFKNHVIEWPKNGNRVSMKLENINAANQFIEGRAHHAMVDVEATLELARRFFKEREMWNYVIGYFNKQVDEKRSQQLLDQTGLMIYGKMGTENFFQSPALLLGTHRHYKNQTLWLRLDTEELAKTTLDSIPETTWAMRKKLAEPGFILPFDEKYSRHLSSERRSLVESNLKWLKHHPDIFQQIINYHLEYKYPVLSNTAVEASLYLNGFMKFEDDQFCRHFHEVSEKEKSSLIGRARNLPLKKLATRLLGKFFPELMSSEQAEEFENYLQMVNAKEDDERMIDFKGDKRTTPKAALMDIAELRSGAELTEKEKKLLDDLENYLKKEFL